MTSPAVAVCVVCGRFPAQVFSIRRHVGLLVMQRFIKVRQPLCREHATALTTSFTLKTLWQGWWGYISFFVNFFVVGANLVVLARAAKMPAPQPVAAQPMYAQPQGGALPAGPPVAPPAMPPAMPPAARQPWESAGGPVAAPGPVSEG